MLVLTLAPLSIARAQQPAPAPPVVTSQLRERLRGEILRTARQTDARYSNVRPELALPLAQLGDWQTALRWTAKENDRNSPRQADIVWHWRATQLARARKWDEVAPAAAHLSQPTVRADALLFAARQMIEGGARLQTPLAQSRQLEAFLNAAAPLLVAATPKQRSYRAYLYARGGDVVASRRVFARVMPQAERADVRALADDKEQYGKTNYFSADNVRAVLQWQIASGLLSDTVNYAKSHLDSADDISLGWWILGARNLSELDELDELVAQLPAEKRVSGLYTLSMQSANLGYRERALARFQGAQALAAVARMASPATGAKALTPDEQQKAALNFGARLVYMALPAALALKDDELIAAAQAQYLEIAKKMPKKARFTRPEEVPLLASIYTLMTPEMMGGLSLSRQKLEEIFADVSAAPPSEMQFRALENLATRFYLGKNNGELLKVAQKMLETARALQQAERAERAAEKDSLFDPYWPQPPRVLTSIFWLQRAGDSITADRFARGFSQNVPARERPYAALTLTKLGFFDLADQIFDPTLEVPLAQKRDRTRKMDAPIDWNAFRSWDDFAATQAYFRAPDAPFRWIEKIDNPNNRANVLVAWTAALFPIAPDQSPFVRVTSNGSSSSVGGYLGTG